MKNLMRVVWLLSTATVAVASNLESFDDLTPNLLSRTPDSEIETFSQCQRKPNAPFWMETIKHTGTSPFLGDPSYSVYRNVKAFGAKGDGVTDDTAAIQRAIDDGGRCFTGCGPGTVAPGKTLKPALIYFPSGTYRITHKLNVYFFTQLVGDALKRPVIKADSKFTDPYLLDSWPSPTQAPFPTTINFYLQLRNFVFDTTAVDPKSTVACINWPTSQAVTLSYNSLAMASGSMHQGIIFNGSTGGGGGSATFMGDLTISGGNIGIRLNNQQFAFRAMHFTNVKTAILIDHIFIASFQGMVFENCGVGIDSTTANLNSPTGSIVLLDSTAKNLDTLIRSQHSKTADGSIIIENLAIEKVRLTVSDHDGNSVLAGSTPPKKVASYTQGTVYNTLTKGSYQETTKAQQRSQALVDSNGAYQTKSRPQYEQYSADCFSSVQDFGALGDGRTDATNAINAALKANANSKVTYFPAGNYRVTDTIRVPAGSRIVGEVWSTISASGANFADESNPRVMFQMGQPGTTGVIEVTDLAFDVADVLPGAILVEVNIAGSKPGDVGLWDSHFRAGGTAGSAVETKCGSYPRNIPGCKAAFMFLHLQPQSSAYLESVWGWVANRDLDGLSGYTNGTSQSIAVGRGMLIESTLGTWLVGTSFEHFVLYQYQLVNAKNVFSSMSQTETVYWQPSPPAPGPWKPNPKYSDPDYSNCDGTSLQCYMGWSLRVVGGSDITFYGLAFWQFFNGLSGVVGPYAQDNIVSIEKSPKTLRLYNLGTHLVKNMVTVDGKTTALAADNKGSWGGLIAAYLPFA